MSGSAGHWRLFLESDVIRYIDLQDKDHVVKIKSVKKGKVTGAGGKSSGKCMLTFEGKDKPMGCGTAILTQIAALLSNDTRSWVGRSITIYPDPTVSFGGLKCGGVRVRPTLPKEDCGTPGKAAATRQVTAEDVADSRKQIDAAEAAEIAKQEDANG